MCEVHKWPSILWTAHQQQAEDGQQQQQQRDRGSLVEGFCRVVFTKSMFQEQLGLRTDSWQKKYIQGDNSSKMFIKIFSLIVCLFF